MYTICLGGAFDIYLYNLSETPDINISGSLSIGPNELPSHFRVNTYGIFEMSFWIKPSREQYVYSETSTCKDTFTCANSVMHITDGSGNGDCCKVGNRIPLLLFWNGTTNLSVYMDADGQNESMTRRTNNKKQRCTTPFELEREQWHFVKLKVADRHMAKGKMDQNSDGSLALFINSDKVCEVIGTRFKTLPSCASAHLFFGTIQPPFEDLHMPASAEIRQFKYGKPPSNLFVGTTNSIQGILSIVLMYPIGQLGDCFNRYTMLKMNVFIGILSAALITQGILTSSVTWLLAGLVFFTCYQQCISAILNAVLADNTTKDRRNTAGLNYKTLSALAMSLGPGIQLMVVLVSPAQDSWSMGTLFAILLPGWFLFPFVGLAIFAMKPVGEKISKCPTTDEAPSASLMASPTSGRMNQAWLDEIVLCGQRRRFMVALLVNIFFIATLLANGMPVRYFSLYFTNVKKFSVSGLCALNATCRLIIAGFAQAVRPLARRFGRANLAVMLHLLSAIFTLGIYGHTWLQPSIALACISYVLRFCCLHARDPMLYSMTMDCVPQDQRSRWAALNSLRSLSFSASAILGGYLADSYGYEFSFNITVLALIACTAIMIPVLVWFPRNEGLAAQEVNASLMSPQGAQSPPGVRAIVE